MKRQLEEARKEKEEEKLARQKAEKEKEEAITEAQLAEIERSVGARAIETERKDMRREL